MVGIVIRVEQSNKQMVMNPFPALMRSLSSGRRSRHKPTEQLRQLAHQQVLERHWSRKGGWEHWAQEGGVTTWNIVVKEELPERWHLRKDLKEKKDLVSLGWEGAKQREQELKGLRQEHTWHVRGSAKRRSWLEGEGKHSRKQDQRVKGQIGVSQAARRTSALPLKEVRSIWRVQSKAVKWLDMFLKPHSSYTINSCFRAAGKPNRSRPGVVDRGGEKWLKSGYFFKLELKGFGTADAGYWETD